MKKIVCFVLLAALSLVTTGAVFADQTDVAPADVKTAIKAAITDPPVSVDFLINVWNDEAIDTYLGNFPDLTVKLSGGRIVFRKTAAEPMLFTIEVMLENTFVSGVDFERRSLLGCEDPEDGTDGCRRIKAMFKATPQSVFWSAVKSATQNRSKQS